MDRKVIRIGEVAERGRTCNPVFSSRRRVVGGGLRSFAASTDCSHGFLAEFLPLVLKRLLGAIRKRELIIVNLCAAGHKLSNHLVDELVLVSLVMVGITK